MEKLLSIRGLEKQFRRGGILKPRVFSAISGIDLDIYSGEVLGIVGESGSGKSTLGRCILGLYKPEGGGVYYFPKDGPRAELSAMSWGKRRKYAKDIGAVFQDPYSSLNPRMTVGEIVAEGPVTAGIFRRGDGALARHVADVCKRAGVGEYMLGRYPHQFSGGQRQRICIARALAVEPRFLVLDECISALDVSVGAEIISLLLELRRERGLAYLFISHDLAAVRLISDRVGVMYLGKIVELGTAKEIFDDPRHPYTAALLSAIPTAEGADERIRLRGEPPSRSSVPFGCPFHPRCPLATERCTKYEPPEVRLSESHTARCHYPEKKENRGGKLVIKSEK